MCGIAGLVHLNDKNDPPSIEVLRSMIAALRHRGPDEFGLYRDTYAGLANARLSILDLVTGQQPLCNEDKTLWIVFNGEIFNYVELREELRGYGHTFKTQSDTEVIVHAYEQWGADCFRRFNGQWAVALWNTRARELVLSRDRIGICPLFVEEEDGVVRFGSEMKAIFSDQSVPREFDLQGIDQTFTYWASQAPVSVFKGIREIRPGSIRIYGPTKAPRDIQYWMPSYRDPSEPFPLSFNEATEALRQKLTTATELRMLRADVPVGSYLSGGLDSSLVALLGGIAKGEKFQTFSICFEDAEFDERSFQRLMASQLDSAHSEIVVSSGDIARAFPAVVEHTERPILRTAPAPLFLLSEGVRAAGIKAVLTGEGADEVLAGYDIFREAKIRRFWSHQPESTWRPRLFERLYPYLARAPQHTGELAYQFWKRGIERVNATGFSHEPRWQTTASLKKFYADATVASLHQNPPPDILESLPSRFSSWDPLAQAQYLEVTTLLSPYLISSQGDRMLMAHSVEGRFPFLDPEVVDFCNSLPDDYKLRILDEKHILKKMADGKLPNQIIRRQKQPYRAPDAISFVGRNAPDYVGEMLSEETLAEAGVFNVARVRLLYDKCVKRGSESNVSSAFSNTDNMALVGILSTQLLHDQYIRKIPGSQNRSVSFKTVVDTIRTGQPQPS